MRKTRIKVKADLVAHADACKAAKLAVDDWCDNSPNIANDNEDKANGDSANIDLAEFGVHTETLLANSVKETCRRWVMEDYTNSSKIDVITTLITNLKADISINKKDSIPVYSCQVAKMDGLDKGNINNIIEDIVASKQKTTRRGGYLVDERVNAGDINDLCQTPYQNLSTGMLEPIFNEMKMSKAVLTKIDKSCFDDNLDSVVLYGIIQDQLLLNTLQRVVVEEVLSHAISNKRYQY